LDPFGPQFAADWVPWELIFIGVGSCFFATVFVISTLMVWAEQQEAGK
jgi:hypothetical protein